MNTPTPSARERKRIAHKIARGRARVLFLPDRDVLVYIPSEGTLVLIVNDSGGLYDFSKCRPMTKKQAHKAVSEVYDAPPQLLAYWHSLIDRAPETTTEGGAI